GRTANIAKTLSKQMVINVQRLYAINSGDSSLHSAIHYPLVQLTERDTVNQFMLFLRSDQAKSILQNYGFSVMTGTDSFAF
ncbi:hypothetical protein, partial [Serratia proteamaculans]|uniref:hypothetical protein n=1 Tax=Serratia proteamaculans TaxID=28151 RepID=UPI003D02D623